MELIDEAGSDLGLDFQKYRQTLMVAIQSEERYLNNINRYVLANTGKELRPILSLYMGRACAGFLKPLSYYVAAVSEMIHTATLMHDDVADQAIMRRDVQTVGSRFSAAAAVLTGDFWLSRALHVLTTKCDSKIISCFTHAVQKMSEGELYQMSKADTLETTEQDYYNIILGKTAALFEACMKSAAYAVEADGIMVDAATSYAKHLGVAFQIRDDIFDYSPDMNTGKAAGADIKERKITLPLLGALKNREEKKDYIKSLILEIENVKNGDASSKEKAIIEEVVQFVHNNGGIAYAQEKLREQSALAAGALAALPQGAAKERLIAFAEFVGTRNK